MYTSDDARGQVDTFIKASNIKIRKNNNTTIAILVFLLVAVIVAGVVIAIKII